MLKLNFTVAVEMSYKVIKLTQSLQKKISHHTGHARPSKAVTANPLNILNWGKLHFITYEFIFLFEKSATN